MLLNDSPWTRKINLWQITGRRLAVFSNGKKAVYQASPSSPPIHYTPEPSRIELERLRGVYAVRWSSAAVVQNVLEKLQEIASVLAIMQAPPPKLSPEHYVLTVRVVKPPAPSGADRLSRATIFTASGHPTAQLPSETPDIFSGLSEEELLQAAELRIDRGRRLKPGKVQRHGLGAGEGISFFFPRAVDGQPTLPPDTKWVEFRVEGRMKNTLKARFKLKEMNFEGHSDY